MFKSTKLLALAGLATVAAGVATPAFAATENVTGKTPVSYDTAQTLDGGSGWAMTIPTSINFTNSKTTADADVTLKASDGYDLKRDFSALSVDTTVTSENGYTLKSTTVKDTTTYSYTLGTKTFAANNTEQSLGAKFELGKLDQDGKQTMDGVATLGKKLGVQASFKDTLTYKFTATFTTK